MYDKFDIYYHNNSESYQVKQMINVLRLISKSRQLLALKLHNFVTL